MSGQAGARGYLFQALVCLLDSLSDREPWLSVTIEPEQDSCKVDITWCYADQVKKVQVKSSVNQIGITQVRRWANELESSAVASAFELRLVGPVSQSVLECGSVGNVLVPPPESISPSAILSQAAHQLDRFLTRDRARPILTADARELLTEALSGRLAQLSANSTTYTQREFRSLLIQWTIEVRPELRSDLENPLGELRDVYRKWISSVTSTFYVPALQIRMPINETWMQLTVLRDNESIVGTKSSIDDQLKNYVEFGQRIRRSDRMGASVEALPYTHQKLVVVGGPGDGKSTLLKRFAWHLSMQGALVILVRLPVVLQLVLEGRSFEESLCDAAFDASGLTITERKRLSKNATHLLCDGLDECDPHRQTICDKLLQWRAGHSNCSMVVTTRPVGHEHALLPGWTHVVLDFPESHQITVFASKVFLKLSETDPNVVSRLPSLVTLLSNERQSSHVVDLAKRNPLLLGFLIRLSVDGIDVGNSRFELYRAIIQSMRRTPPNDRRPVLLDATVAEYTLGYIGWCLMKGPFVSPEELRNEVQRGLGERFALDELKASKIANDAIEFWESRGLLETISAGRYSRVLFVHRSFQEYAASTFISQLGEEEKRRTIVKVRRKPEWLQVILLLAGSEDGVKTITELMDLDRPHDPVSREALIAADAIQGVRDLDRPTCLRIVGALWKRLMSDIPLVSVEASLRLCKIVNDHPQLIQEHLVGESPPTEDGRIGVRLLNLKVTQSDEAAKRFSEWLQTRTPRQRAVLAESNSGSVTFVSSEAADLEEEFIECGFDLVFEKLAVEEIERLFDNLGEFGGFSLRMIENLQTRLRNVGLTTIAENIFKFDPPDMSWITSDIKSFKECKTDLMHLVAEACGESTEELDVTPPYLNLSVFLSGLGYWESTAGQLARIAGESEVSKREAVAVCHALINALSLSLKVTGNEARCAIARLSGDTTGYELFVQTDAVPDWGKVSTSGTACESVAQAVLHTSPLIARAAAAAVSHARGGAIAVDMIQPALESDYFHTATIGAHLAMSLLGEASVPVILERLERPIHDGHAALFSVLALYSSGDQREAIIKAFQAALTTNNPVIALAVAGALQDISPPLESEARDWLRVAWDTWAKDHFRCPRDGNTISRSGSCSKCKRYFGSPRASLLLQRCRLGDLGLAELIELVCDSETDVAKVASEEILSQANADSAVAFEVLRRVEAGELPSKIVDELLKQPIERDSQTAVFAESLLDSNNWDLRRAIVRQLTGAWIDRSRAEQLLRKCLSDEQPAIRDSAVRSLRLLAASAT